MNHSPRVLVLYKMKSRGRDLLEKYFNVEYLIGKSQEEVMEELSKGAFGLLVTITHKIDKKILDYARGLKIISTQSAGYDHIDVEYATKLGIVVARVVGLLQETVAEHAVAMMLTLARRLHISDNIVRNGLWASGYSIWSKFKNLPLMYGKVAGIFGMGEIGKRLVPKLKGLGMEVIYYSRKRKNVDATYVSFDTLIRESDVLFITVPFTSETKGIINYEILKKMKPTAYIINVSRGGIVVESDLVKALKEGIIAGAALDVFEKEPLSKDSPLTELENVVLSPHYAGTSLEAIEEASYLAAKNVVDLYLGRVPKGIINPEVLKR